MRAPRSATLRVASLILLTAGIAAAPRQSPQAVYELVIGRVIDGTGAPARRADIAVKDGRIARVGTFAATSKDRIDAAGLVVTPGFIDVHTHADDVADHPLAENFIRMGVTSIVAGNCGSSALSIGDALTRIRETGIAVNFATLIGHNTLRASVMGRDDRYSTLGELNRMKALVFKGMADGAVGFSTGLQYVPGTYARNNEIVELARVAANQGGIYATHMRNEGTRLDEAVAESIRVARLIGGVRVQISHLKVDSPSRWGASAAALKLIDDAIGRGLKIGADQYAYTAGSSSLDIRFPAWALEGGAARVRQRLDDPPTWSRIKVEMQQLLADRGFNDLSWATVATYRPDPSLGGLSMKDVAVKLVGDSSADAQLEAARLLMRSGGATMVYHFMSEDDIARIMKHPMVSIASDSGVIDAGAGVPHPRGYGNTARVLGVYVRERKILSLEEAVRKMTSLPAAQFAFAGRGVIREGAAADLVVLDPARVRDTATYEAPHAYPEGIPYVVVNGVPVVRDGKVTGERAGQVIRGGTPEPRPSASSGRPELVEGRSPGTDTPLGRQGATVTIAYRAASEDDASTGRVTLSVAAGQIARASVWEHACTVRSRADAESPGTDADQFWSFRADLTTTRTQVTTVRLRYRLVTAAGQGPELERVLVVDGRDTLSLEGFSARRDCRYDRVLVTVSARPAAARGPGPAFGPIDKYRYND
jgi:N-acyl-D-amino-acid deacylase